MEEPLSVDTTSNFSSIAEAPDHLERQYAPLSEAFHGHSAELPQRGPADSNSEAMISALKALQDKIHSLELERVAAADKFRHLAHETQQQARGTKRAVLVEGGSPLLPSSRTSPLPGYPSSPSPEQEDLKARLEAIDAKFTLQARELEHMRERLQRAESGHHKAFERGRLLEEQQRELMEEQRKRRADSTSHTQSGIAPTLNREAEKKLRRLEQEHAKMTTIHTQTESKVKDLEGLLMEEQWHRKRIQDRTAKLQSAAEMNRIMLERTASDQAKKMPVKKRKKTSRKVHTCMCGAQYGSAIVCKCKPVPGVHYRMNMKDVPFVVGTSVTPSHSVGANYQNVLALMKTHSPLLCGAVAATRGRRATARRLPSSVSHTELRSLLAGLEEELGRLTFEHQELAKQIQEQTDPAHPQATSGLERQLELLVEHLETKAEQIKIVRKQLLTRRQRSRSRSRLHQATASLPVARDGEVEVTTTVKAKGSPQSQAYSTVDCKTPSLEFLKKMKSLQNTLQRDDLSWD